MLNLQEIKLNIKFVKFVIQCLVAGTDPKKSLFNDSH